MSKEDEAKMKETSAYAVVKTKEEEEVDVFYGATTIPDRVAEYLPDGTKLEGEILSKQALQDMADKINDTTRTGGKVGAYRTISLFHDRVLENNQRLEEAGYVQPTAQVVPHKDVEGAWALEVETKVNKYYAPSDKYIDYTPDKISYKIANKAIGLSVEYNNSKDHERLVKLNDGIYRYVERADDFQGFGYARANVIGNTTAVAIKELREELDKNLNRGNSKMEEQFEAKVKELEAQQTKDRENIAKLKEQLNSADEAKTKELDSKIEELNSKIKEAEVGKDEMTAKIKETFDVIFDKMGAMNSPASNGAGNEQVDAKLKEMSDIISKPEAVHKVGNAKVKEYAWGEYKELADAKLKEQEVYLKKTLARDGSGIDFEGHRSLKVKCVGRTFVVEPTAKTKDVIDTGSMEEGTYLQTNAFFADRYTPGITETFLMEDSLLTAMTKEAFAGGNDKYQWKIWTEFGNFDGDNTAAVDPDNTSVQRTKRDFLKLQTPIREYRDGVEVTDFTQAHSAAAVGDLMGEEIMRAAEYVRNSMNADLYKAKTDATSGWYGFIGLVGVADSATYGTIYGRTRSAANKLLDATTANTYVSTSEAINHSVVRTGYEKVLAHGAGLSNIAVAMHPTQVRKLFDAADNNISGTANTSSILRGQLALAGAPADFGFNRSLIPHVDGIPIIRDYRCESSLNAQDMFAVVDMSPSQGFVLVTSKPLDVRGLAKVGTSESSYVSFWGAAVYKNVLNVFVHDSLTV